MLTSNLNAQRLTSRWLKNICIEEIGTLLQIFYKAEVKRSQAGSSGVEFEDFMTLHWQRRVEISGQTSVWVENSFSFSAPIGLKMSSNPTAFKRCAFASTQTQSNAIVT